MKNKILTLTLTAILISSLMIFMMQFIFPANQLSDRGVGIQIRPANLWEMWMNGNSNYMPHLGSRYNSGFE